MQQVEPKVYLLAETRHMAPAGGFADMPSTPRYLSHMGAPDWETDAVSDGEELVEIMGRSCYKSFKPGLNANVSKVREGNKSHLQNIVKVGHGSVLEHASVTFMFCDVSRVFTHELVRHRVGVAISQESLRFVRLTELRQWIPTCITHHPRGEELCKLYESTFEQLEHVQRQLAEILELDTLPFAEKKVLTSAMRRLAPIGLATNIGWTANFRTLRHVLEMRTAPSAEEEMRIVFGQVGRILMDRYPAVFGDYEVKLVDGFPCFTTENRKV